MSILSERTERKALFELAKTLGFFDNLNQLLVSNEDAFDIANAERLLMGIIQDNGYEVFHSEHVGAKLKKGGRYKQFEYGKNK